MATKKTVKAQKAVETEPQETAVVEQQIEPQEPTYENIIQTGKVQSILKIATGNCADYRVRFERPFVEDTIPDVVVGFLTNSTAARFGTCACAVLEGSVNHEGFTIRFFNGDTSSRIPHFSYIAFGKVIK